MKPITKRQLRIAGSYGVVALLALAGVALWAEPPPFQMLALFAVAFVVLEFNAVEVNDRMFQSSSIMVLLTAGTLFAINADSSAAFGMAVMAALGPFVPQDFKERRWFQPLANFGQMVFSAAVAGLLLDWFLADIDGFLTPSGLVRVAAAGAAASAVYTWMNIVMVRFAVRFVYGQRNLLPWSGLHVLLPSQVLMGIVGGVLGAAFDLVGRTAVIVLILVVYLIGHLSLSSYSQLREAHQSALRGFVKVLEARDMYTRGHTERVAYFSQLIGEELHVTGTQLERLRWASLIHDLGKLAISGELLSRRGQVSADERVSMRESAAKVQEILGEVDFLRPMVGISGVHYIDLDEFDPASWTLDASIIAVADAFDAMTSTRSYRMAKPQAVALAELREDDSGRFFPDVVNALENGLARTGEVYGGFDMGPSAAMALDEASRG